MHAYRLDIFDNVNTKHVKDRLFSVSVSYPLADKIVETIGTWKAAYGAHKYLRSQSGNVHFANEGMLWFFMPETDYLMTNVGMNAFSFWSGQGVAQKEGVFGMNCNLSIATEPSKFYWRKH